MERIMEQIVAQYFAQGVWEVNDGSSGCNNTTRFLSVTNEMEDTRTYIVRIYESHQDLGKVAFEHHVLNALNQQQLGFKVPQPITNLKGSTIGRTATGKLVSIAKAIEGKNPQLQSARQYRQLGEIIGELTVALGALKVDTHPAYYPCYDLDSAYPSCPLTEVLAFCNAPPEGFDQARFCALRKYFIAFREVLPSLKALPHQLTHGDVNASNVLENKEGQIDTVLDFEFVTWDLRLMDLAVGLSETLKIKGDQTRLWEEIKNFLEGYSQHVTLTEAEKAVLPDLLILRKLDVLIHFMVRYKEGISNAHLSAEDILKEQVVAGLAVCEWVEANRGRLRACLDEMM